METKDFEDSVKFTKARVKNQTYWLPLVEVGVIGPTGTATALILLFDTGATFTTLKADLYPLFGLTSWDEGKNKVEVAVLGEGRGKRMFNYQYNTTLEVFGKQIDCPIHLTQGLQAHPLYSGLLGRDTIFNEFGFGFWENVHELYVTKVP